MGSEIERIDKQAGVSDLPAATAAHEAPKLLLVGPSLPRRLFLEGAKRPKVTLRADDLFHRGGAESADQLVLEVCDADVKTQLFHVDPREVRAQAGLLETTLELALLGRVTETSQSEVRTSRPEQIQEVSDRLRTSNRHHGNALGMKISTTALSEGLERDLVAHSFDEHDRT